MPQISKGGALVSSSKAGLLKSCACPLLWIFSNFIRPVDFVVANLRLAVVTVAIGCGLIVKACFPVGGTEEGKDGYWLLLVGRWQDEQKTNAFCFN